MSAFADFLKYVKSAAPAGGSGIPRSGGGPGGGVYNPGEMHWNLILGNKSVQSSSHSAGAIRRFRKYDDFEGWQPRDFEIIHQEKDDGIRVAFKISAQVRGYPKGGPGDELYVREVRVWGAMTGGVGFVDADVEDAHAIWETWAAVAFTLVIRIGSGRKRTVRRAVSVHGDGTNSVGEPVVTFG
jgi:hypothetical protein